MKLLKVMQVLFAIGFSANSNALSVYGGDSCGKWVKDRAEPNQPTLNAVIDEKWLIGFISGIVAGTNVDFLKQTDPDSIYLWMDNYCKKNPLSTTLEGGEVLAIELTKRLKK
jgi:hypothetical protein